MYIILLYPKWSRGIFDFICIFFDLFPTGVKATYLLAVAFLEIIRFSCNGGILNGDSSFAPSRSAFSCAFEYLMTPNLLPAVFQCLTAIVHRAFETAVAWLVTSLPSIFFFFFEIIIILFKNRKKRIK